MELKSYTNMLRMHEQLGLQNPIETKIGTYNYLKTLVKFKKEKPIITSK